MTTDKTSDTTTTPDTTAPDIDAARRFLVAQGRLIDRHRLALALGGGDPEHALRVLDAYRNPDGGYGWSLEPDLRATTSQPAGALHAFEVMAEAAPATTPRAAELCDWLATVTRPDGGLPFVLPLDEAAGSSPVWTTGDTTTSSLQITSAVAAFAHRVGRHDPAVRNHPWLATATDFCLDRIAETDRPEDLFVLELRFALWLLDAVVDDRPELNAELDRMTAAIPPSGALPVPGGAPGEKMRPLDFTPWPDRPLRRRFDAGAVDADVEKLVTEQRPDGGWAVDFESASPGGAQGWRSSVTVWAVQVLRAHGRA
ncbi:MAG TPA: hypothetical protein VIL48_15515 [Acidimicrobiales bacterium]